MNACRWMLVMAALCCTVGPAVAEDSPFRVLLPGDHPAGPLDAVHVDVRMDTGVATPRMAVGAERDVATGEVLFSATWNYPAFVHAAQVEVLHHDGRILDVALLDATGSARWQARDGAVAYRLRLVAPDSTFDLGWPRPLPGTGDQAQPIGRADQAQERHIAVRGALVEVQGRGVPDGHDVAVLGRRVALQDGAFVHREILPPGHHPLAVAVGAQGVEQLRISREVAVPSQDWFWVGLGDLTWQDLEQAGQHEQTTTGRLAGYVQGRVRGDVLFTAMLDTGEDDIEDLLGNLDDRDPRQLLRRLDPEQYYPVYGDRSRTVEDAPTQGRLYLRLERGESRLVVGNFETAVQGTAFAQLDRGLHGALVRHASEATTSDGEARTRVTAFASDPGTVPGRDEFLGTGGSVYYLGQQDVAIGSDRLRVEIRDQVSNRVLETRDLVAGSDYEIDYLQGRVLLTRPLRSRSADGELVRDGSLPGHPVVLVARYEYTPAFGDLDGMTVGGRATHWVGDDVRVGVTAQRDRSADADQQLLGVDAQVRLGAASGVQVELARSEGQGFGASGSVDGGFLFSDPLRPDSGDEGALAGRIEVDVVAGDLGLPGDAALHLWAEQQDAGFSGSGRPAQRDVRRGGVDLRVAPAERLDLRARADRSLADGADSTRLVLQAELDLDGGWRLGSALQHGDQQFGAGSPALAGAPEARAGSLATDDDRATVLAMQLGWSAPDDSWGLHGFAQDGLSGSGREAARRAGIGGEWQVSERQRIGGELAVGDDGMALGSTWDLAVGDWGSIYLTYDLLTGEAGDARVGEQADDTLGTLTLGGRSQLSERLSVWGEERWGRVRGLSERLHAWGGEYRPADAWTLGLTLEQGTVEDPLDGAFERSAWSASLGWARDGWRVGGALERRDEDGAGDARDRDTWLLRSSAAARLTPAWEVLAKLNLARSQAVSGNIRDSHFTESVLALAWRPGAGTAGEQRRDGSLLFSATWLEDLAPDGQRTATGSTGAPQQRSAVLSVDGDWQVRPRLRLGGRLAIRHGEVALGSDSDSFVDSTAQLAVLRLDWAWRRRWDLLLEGRALHVSIAEDLRQGLLVSLHRRLGDHVRLGAGYSFVDFSADLTDQDYNSRGWFLNLTGAL